MLNCNTCTISNTILTKAKCFDSNQTVLFSDKYEY